MNKERENGVTSFLTSEQLAKEFREIRWQDGDNILLKNYEAQKELESALFHLEEEGELTPEIGEKALFMVKKYGFLAAERLVCNWHSPWHSPEDLFEVDFTEYSELAMNAYERFGRKVGGYFCFSYKPAIVQGLSGQEYFDLVAQTVGEQGKLIARWFARYLPGVLAVGGNPHEFRKALKRVYRIGKMRTMKAYARQAAGMEAHDFTINESADFVEETFDRLGEGVGFWVIQHLGITSELGYHPYAFLRDTQSFFTEQGERIARWYASGYSGFSGALRHLRYELDIRRAWLGEDGNVGIKGIEEAKKLLDPRVYKEEYLRLLTSIGPKGAIFFARCINGLKEDFWRHLIKGSEMIDLRDFADEILGFEERVGEKVFNDTVGLLPMIASNWGGVDFNLGIKEIAAMMGEISELYEKDGEEVAINAIRYTYGKKRRGGGVWSLVDPRMVIKKPLEEKFWVYTGDELGAYRSFEQERAPYEDGYPYVPEEEYLEMLELDDESSTGA